MRTRWLAISLVISACSQPSLRSRDPQERIQAIAAAGSQDRFRTIPDLLPSLASSDALVRQQAQRALVDRTGTTRGYDWADPPERREQAIAGWRAWCVERGLIPKEPSP